MDLAAALVQNLEDNRARAFAAELLNNVLTQKPTEEEEQEFAEGTRTYAGYLIERRALLAEQLRTVFSCCDVLSIRELVQQLVFETAALNAPFTLGSTMELSLVYLFCRMTAFFVTLAMRNPAQFCSSQTESQPVINFNLINDVCVPFMRTPSDLHFRFALQAILLDTCRHKDHILRCCVCNVFPELHPFGRAIQVFSMYRERLASMRPTPSMRVAAHGIECCVFLIQLLRKFPKHADELLPVIDAHVAECSDGSVKTMYQIARLELTLFRVRFASDDPQCREPHYMSAKRQLDLVHNTTYEDPKLKLYFGGPLMQHTPATLLLYLFNTAYKAGEPLPDIPVSTYNAKNPFDRYVWLIAQAGINTVRWRAISTCEHPDVQSGKKYYKTAQAMLHNAIGTLNEVPNSSKIAIVPASLRLKALLLENLLKVSSTVKTRSSCIATLLGEIVKELSESTIHPPWMSPVMGAGLDLFNVAFCIASLCGHIVVQISKGEISPKHRQQVDTWLKTIIEICKKTLDSLEYHEGADSVVSLLRV